MAVITVKGVLNQEEEQEGGQVEEEVEEEAVMAVVEKAPPLSHCHHLKIEMPLALETK
jgi:hypothetical protein